MQRRGTGITLAASVLPKDCFKEPRLHLGTAQLQLGETDASRSAWKRAEMDLACEALQECKIGNLLPSSSVPTSMETLTSHVTYGPLTLH